MTAGQRSCAFARADWSSSGSTFVRNPELGQKDVGSTHPSEQGLGCPALQPVVQRRHEDVHRKVARAILQIFLGLAAMVAGWGHRTHIGQYYLSRPSPHQDLHQPTDAISYSLHQCSLRGHDIAHLCECEIYRVTSDKGPGGPLIKNFLLQVMDFLVGKYGDGKSTAFSVNPEFDRFSH